jgi:isopentenyl diphosphate isomerase/L-lactate dehydrogenase-like FMN-dependent dehydrogenase
MRRMHRSSVGAEAADRAAEDGTAPRLPGVDRVLEILDDEFTTIMRQVGALNINQITRENVTPA